MNLLYDPLVQTRPAGWLSLPGVLSALARGEVASFPALRPHQRAAWHCFLVQLGALALDRAGQDALPETEDGWRTPLEALSSDGWDLVAPEGRPAFMQPPAPKGLKWTDVATPDALDLLITARNHDLKQAVAEDSDPQDWIFALVSLQTSEGYGGAGNFGIARMNRGSSSRPMLAFIPDPDQSGSIDPALWWRRDVAALLRLRVEGREVAPGQPGGPALLWLLGWPEGGTGLDLTRLDPWFIEVCRRIRLERRGGRIGARRTTSKAARVDATAFSGVTGDPWTPVTAEKPRSLTLGDGEFSYRRMCDLLFSAGWRRPALAEPQEGEADGLILAEALGRGNSKTDGLKSRLIPVPGAVVASLWRKSMAEMAAAQIEEIAHFDNALKFGLATAAADGAGDLSKPDYERSRPARRGFDTRADTLFFPALFDRVEADETGGLAGLEAARVRFLHALRDAARAEFALALRAIPTGAIWRPRAEARARRVFERHLRAGDYGALLAPHREEDTDDAA